MKRTEQLKGWAVDRAIELRKGTGNPYTVANVLQDAEALMAFVNDGTEGDDQEEGETIQ